MERRIHPRINERFSTIVRGLDAEGRRFQIQSETENLSAGGALLRTDRNLQPGGRLFFYIRFRNGGSAETGATVGALGFVIRSEGEQGTAVRFTRHRFV